MERYKKLTLLHSNDMHGDFLAQETDEKLVGGAQEKGNFKLQQK